jgi:hypothetical protein
MKTIEIKNRYTGDIILSGNYESIKDALEKNNGADLSGANLSRVNLSGANLSRVNLSRADLYGANLSRVNLSRADLYGANLSRADLYGADLTDADLYGADLSGANLSRANLYGVNLSRVNLYGADLSRADLYGANLSRANLSRVNLYGANLSGANLSRVKGIKFPIISICGVAHSFFYHDKIIQIGCECHTVKEWIKNYKKIGESNNYTTDQIAEYYEYIKMCKKYTRLDAVE